MKISCRVIIMLFLISLSNTAYSQSFGFQFGLNCSNVLFEGNFKEEFNDGIVPRIDIRLGINYKIPITSFFNIETGLAYSKEGYIDQFHHFDYEGEFNYQINYLELPLHLNLKVNLKKSSLILLTGSYLAYGVTGSLNHSYSDIGGNKHDKERKIIWSNEGPDFKRLDYGLKLGVGLDVKSYRISLIYKMGLNIISDNYGVYLSPAKYNRVFSLSLSYYLPN